MIINDFKTESIVQVNDLFRVDCSKVMLASGFEVDLIEIDLGEGDGFVEVYNRTTAESNDSYEVKKYLDAIYNTSGEKTVTVKATSGVDVVSKAKTITVLSEEEDNLFSSDEDLVTHEEAIFELLREGKNSFKNIHRLAQQDILLYLQERYPDEDITKSSLVDITQVRSWSKFLTLYYIFQSNVNTTDDIHQTKAQLYKGLAEDALDSSVIALDLDGDGEEDTQENMFSIGIRL